jgi:FKBP-type peptidyl-prolyl cis-trans isomerase
MNKKQINIIIILALVVVIIFAGLGFLGFNGFPFGTPQTASPTDLQSVLNEIKSTGKVADLRVIDTNVGTGDPVVTGDTVSVLYTGVLPDGTVFDSSQAHGDTPLTFVVGDPQLIEGWNKGILGMKEGGRRLLAIPASLAYGAEGKDPIPPNATILFDIQLVKRVPAGSPMATSTPTNQ